MLGCDRSDGAETFARVLLHPGRDLAKLGIGQTGIGLGERNQIIALPDGEGEIGEQVRAPPVPCLGIDHHTIDGQRVQLPLPPVALLPAIAVRAVQSLQHNAFGPQGTRPGPRLAQVIPTLESQKRRRAQRKPLWQFRHQTGQAFPPVGEGQGADVLAPVFQKVIGPQDHRRVLQKRLRHRFPPDTLLQRVKALRRVSIMIPGQKLAIQHGAIRQEIGQNRQFGKAIRHQLFTPRPDKA